MNYKPFPQLYWTEVITTIKKLKDQNTPLYAAFDADGTLWDTDLGENFFQYEIDHHLVSLPSDPWNHYQEMKKINNDPRSAYLWLAQINADKKLSEVQSWAHKAFQQIQPSPIFSEQRKLIELFLKNDVKVFIVTASVKWAVEPGAIAIGLGPENVIGIETVVNSGTVSDVGIEPITYRQGKVAALLKATNGTKPFFGCGNTMGDYELINSATNLHLCVSAAAQDEKLYRTEHELFTEAEKSQWWRHRFI